LSYKHDVKGKNPSSEEFSAQRMYALLYKISSDIERLDLMLRAIKKQTEVKNDNEQ